MYTAVLEAEEDETVQLSSVLEDIASMDLCPGRVYRTYCFGFGGERFSFSTSSRQVHLWLGLMKPEAQYHLAKFIEKELSKHGTGELRFVEKGAVAIHVEVLAEEHCTATFALSLTRA